MKHILIKKMYVLMITKCGLLFSTKGKKCCTYPNLFELSELEEVDWNSLGTIVYPYYYVVCEAFLNEDGKVRIENLVDKKITNDYGVFSFWKGRLDTVAKEGFKSFYSDWKLHMNGGEFARINKHGVLEYFCNGKLHNGKYNNAVYNKFGENEKYINGKIEKGVINYNTSNYRIVISDNTITYISPASRTIRIAGKLIDTVGYTDLFYFRHIGTFSVKNGLIEYVYKYFPGVDLPKEEGEKASMRMPAKVIRLR